METDITHHIERYRDCLKTVWNGYFRDLPEGWHEFINVRHELFVGLVLVQAFDGYTFGSPQADIVRLRPAGEGVEARWNPSVDTGAEWSPRVIGGADCELAFVELFDQRDHDGAREFELVRAVVVSHPRDPSLEGGQVMLPTGSASYFVHRDA